MHAVADTGSVGVGRVREFDGGDFALGFVGQTAGQVRGNISVGVGARALCATACSSGVGALLHHASTPQALPNAMLQFHVPCCMKSFPGKGHS